ncbi:Dabb family protein [Chitinivorax sp. B]|uniref:Dabb family protein n=1 Tax=Chitinivorax sp. B TaxID=2502235 RepID=UPI0010F81495|nr:Dabb family protein [Chitinivorax sp. B]
MSNTHQPVRHIVIFKYRHDATAADIQQVTDGFRTLKERIPGITAFEHGSNHSQEGHDQGFHHVYTVTFTDAAARDAYLPHPAHQAFVSWLSGSGILKGVFVVDYQAQT